MCELGVGDHFTTLGTAVDEVHEKKLMCFTMKNIHGASYTHFLYIFFANIICVVIVSCCLGTVV